MKTSVFLLSIIGGLIALISGSLQTDGEQARSVPSLTEWVVYLPIVQARQRMSVVYLPGSTRKVCQLTGEFDRERQQFTLNRTESRVGLAGTDLGVSFEHNGRLYFLFGDTWPPEGAAGYNSYRPRDGDSIASTPDANPEDCIELQFVTAPDGRYLSPQVPGISLASFEVPIAGFSANGKMYVFFSTDHSEKDVMGRTILAWSADEARSPFHYVYDVSRAKFINISPVIVNNADIPGLPDRQGQGLLLWGAGRYRQSDPYLAYVPLNTVEDKRTWRYFAGMEAGSLQPIWSTQEADAMPLFVHPCLGEFSVAWNPFLRQWLMLYNCESPRGINFRVADRPWGPWSPPAVLFDPWADGGYCHFMHVSWDFRNCDSVYDSMFGSPRQRVWGGEYGPYQISRYTTGDATGTTIYYTMSTWNPYQVVLMRSTLRREPIGQAMTATGVPSFFQSRFGRVGNFEVMVPLSGGGLAHSWRNNDLFPPSWSWPIVLQDVGQIDAVAFIQSNFGTPGNFEVVARAGDRLIFLWRDTAGWHGPYPLIADGREVTGVTGNPAFIQSRYGRQGNFEVVVPLTDGGLAHYWRDNDSPGLPWHGPVVFGTSAGRIDAVALIQSNFGTPGNLEIVARAGERLIFFWNDVTSWYGPYPLIADGREVTGVTGNPALIQSRLGRTGNFEVIVPLAGGGLAHYWRDNDSPGLPWHGPIVFGTRAGRIDAVTLIQSNFGESGNLEVIARIGGQLAHFWWDTARRNEWQGPFFLPFN